MAIAAESGFRMATLASMRLLDVSTASMASGMPWPFDLVRAVLGHHADDQPADDGHDDDPGPELIRFRTAKMEGPHVIERQIGEQADQVIQDERDQAGSESDGRRQQRHESESIPGASVAGP